VNYEAEGTGDVRTDMSSFYPVFWTTAVVNCISVALVHRLHQQRFVGFTRNTGLRNSGRNKWTIFQYYNAEIINTNLREVGSGFATVRFRTIHFYAPCRDGPSAPDLWYITVATQASFLYLVRFQLFAGVHVFLIFIF
jgi:hypothetical protein